MNRLIKKTFENRGYTEEFLYDIDNPAHGDLKDLDTLCSRLKHINDNHIPIAIYPDFDTDGISSGVLGFAGMAELRFNVNLFVPDSSKGYGISAETMQDLLQRFPDTKVVITCDTGIEAAEAAAICRNAGVQLLITDHHIQKTVIDADIIVNPMRIDETYTHPQICGAHVLYQVLQRYADTYCNYFAQDQIRRLRVFAGIGTISDVMPVLYENRQLVRDAITICRYVYNKGDVSCTAAIPGCDIYRKVFWGLYQFFKVCENAGIIHSEDDIDETFFGFYLAPMLNSVKRMDGNMNRAFGAFLSNTLYEDAEYLYNVNLKRKESIEIELAAIKNIPQPFAPYVYISGAKLGILGLLATKLMQETGCPTFVVTLYENGYKGSGRLPDWYSIDDSAMPFISVAGHELAFGCRFDSYENMAKFASVLMDTVPAAAASLSVAEEVFDFVISPDWTADTGIDIDLFHGYLDEIENYHPFGKGFPAPKIKFVFRNSDVLEWKQLKNKKHLKICFANGFSVLCWNQGSLVTEKDKDGQHIVVGHLEKSDFQNNVSINFVGDLAVIQSA